MQAASRTLTSPANLQGGIFFSPDGNAVVAACADRIIRTWDVASGKITAERTRPKDQGPARLLNAKSYADVGPKHTVRIWDLTAEAANRTLYGHAAQPQAIAMSADGRWIASASEKEARVRLWNAATGEQKFLLSDGIGGVAALAFSADGETLVSTNYDNDVRVWKTRSGELIRKMDEMTGAMFAAAFTPDGKHFVMAGLDETVYVYDTKEWRDNSRRSYNEPAEMTRDLVALGVPADRIYQDYAGFRTLDSVVRAAKVFGLREFMAISQPFHNERAVYIARAHGLKVIGLAARDLPADAGLKTQIRERFARVAALLDLHVLHRKPKFLGPRIEIGA